MFVFKNHDDPELTEANSHATQVSVIQNSCSKIFTQWC